MEKLVNLSRYPTGELTDYQYIENSNIHRAKGFIQKLSLKVFLLTPNTQIRKR